MTLRLIPVSLLLCASFAHAGILRQGAVQILCHRTDNRDVPENTLESLAQAALLGCNVVEVDVRRTLDGTLVLNHDGYLDRFTGTTGDIETTDIRELDRMDFGAWRGPRFAGMRLAHFDDALRLARHKNIGLYLDIKTKGLGPQIFAAVAREAMTERVFFGGEWDDVRALHPYVNVDDSVYVQPGITRTEVERLHHEGKIVVGNFLSNGHETDLPGMRAAVAAGVDCLWVEYPRLGAEAAGRPVEATLSRLLQKAGKGTSTERVGAIRALSEYVGFPLQRHFLPWLEDSDEAVSHAAALALVLSRPTIGVADLQSALHAPAAASRSNAAWVIGEIAAQAPKACVPLLSPLLGDPSAQVVKASLMALIRCPAADDATLPVAKLLPLMDNAAPVVRGLAAVVLAKYQPEVAALDLPLAIAKDEADAAAYDLAWAKRGRPALTQAQIDPIIETYRSEMKYMQALALLPISDGLEPLSSQAFRSVHDVSNVTALVAGYQLWDCLGSNPRPAIEALRSPDPTVADRAEWALVAAGQEVLPAVRAELATSSGAPRSRLIRIVAWQADQASLTVLHQMLLKKDGDEELIRWAADKIEMMEVH